LSAPIDTVTGVENVGIGINALRRNTTGSNNIGIGTSALESNTTGLQNIAIGDGVLGENITGSLNIGIGIGALASLNPAVVEPTQGIDNIAIGINADNNDVEGSYNIVIGNNACPSNSFSEGLVIIGYGADILADGVAGSTVIGANAFVDGTSCLSLGSYTTNTGQKVGIYNSMPLHALHVGIDDAFKPTTNVWNTPSDIRIKKNIQDIGSGLEIINKLRPRTFSYVKEYAEHIGDSENKVYNGFIADEVEQVMPQCVKVSNEHIYGKAINDWIKLSSKERKDIPKPEPVIENIKSLNMGEISAFEIKAIQELSAMVSQLQDRVSQLESR
jgi:hypothetical protein